MHRLSLLKGSPQRAMKAVLQIQIAAPGHDVGEKVAIERGILLEQSLEIERPLRRDELVETHLMRRDRGPLLLHVTMVRVWASVADTLKDHCATVGHA